MGGMKGPWHVIPARVQVVRTHEAWIVDTRGTDMRARGVGGLAPTLAYMKRKPFTAG